ncbi:MAG: hypothetical protein ACK5II_12885 [Paracoccus sp. (in: a-proteobacteria)]
MGSETHITDDGTAIKNRSCPMQRANTTNFTHAIKISNLRKTYRAASHTLTYQI